MRIGGNGNVVKNGSVELTAITTFSGSGTIKSYTWSIPSGGSLFTSTGGTREKESFTAGSAEGDAKFHVAVVLSTANGDVKCEADKKVVVVNTLPSASSSTPGCTATFGDGNGTIELNQEGTKLEVFVMC